MANEEFIHLRSIQLAYAVMLVNICMKETKCSRCKFIDSDVIGGCSFTRYHINTTLKKFIYCRYTITCKTCFLHSEAMETNLIKCSISFMLYNACAKHKGVLG